jgi:hypothetical protein
MTRKDYVIIAAALKSSKPTDAEGQNAAATWRLTVEAIENVLAGENSHFDCVAFDAACGND